MQGEKGTVIGGKNMKNEEYKKMSIKEFTKAAGRYESNHAGIYEMCKKDYPDILEELEKEPFRDLLDAGCGPAPMISLFFHISIKLLMQFPHFIWCLHSMLTHKFISKTASKCNYQHNC